MSREPLCGHALLLQPSGARGEPWGPVSCPSFRSFSNSAMDFIEVWWMVVVDVRRVFVEVF